MLLCVSYPNVLLVSAVLQMENSYNALLVAIDPNQDEDLLPPEAFIPAGPITPEGHSLFVLLC